jgi:choline transport protein
MIKIFPIIAMAFTAQGILTASSRMTYAFARDGGLPFSPLFARMHHTGVPIPAVLLTTVCVIIFGCIYLGSSAALNAILSSSVVFLNVSYSIPSAFHTITDPVCGADDWM